MNIKFLQNMVLGWVLLIVFSLAISVWAFGCRGRTEAGQKVARQLKVEDGQGRFTVESHGKVCAGYREEPHELLIILDQQTGKKYLGITGVGMVELVYVK